MLSRICHRYGPVFTLVVKQEPGFTNDSTHLRRNFRKSCLIHNVSLVAEQNIDNIVNSPYKAVRISSYNLPELIWSRIDRHPNHIAIECGLSGRKYTYTQLHKLSHKLAVSLLKAGLKKGQTVVIITPNCAEHPILYLGALEVGLTVTPISSLCTVDEICLQLKESDIACVISATEQLDTIMSAVKKLTEAKRNETDVKFIALDVNQDLTKDLPPVVGRFSDLIADHVDDTSLDSLRSYEVRAKTVAACPYSSGTTGLPKGVQLTHINFVSSVLQLSAPEVCIQSEATETYQDVIPCVIPFAHAFGFANIMMMSLFHGSKLVILPKFKPESYLQVFANHKCSVLYLVPPLASFIATHPAVKKELFQHVKYLLCGSASIGKSDVERCLQRIGKGSELRFLQAYGMTEALCVSHPRNNCTNVETVGAPLPNTSVKVVHTATKQSLGPYQDGEIVVKGPQVMKGYYNNPLTTTSPKDGDGWLRTGDIGHYDENSNFYIVDRLKELIKVKGFQVSPTELEDLLRTHPAVLDVGVVGISDQKSGEIPIAYVVKSPKHPTFTSDLQEYVASKLAPHKKLHDVVFVDEIPKSPSGKILRKEIRKHYMCKTLKT